MKRLPPQLLVPLTSLLIAGVVLVFWGYQGRKRAFDKAIEVELSMRLATAFDEYSTRYSAKQIDPVAFTRLLLLASPEPSTNLIVTPSPGPLAKGSTGIICVVEYKRHYVGICGNGKRLPLSEDAYVLWKQEASASPVPDAE